MKKSYILSGIMFLTCITGINAMQPERPEFHQIIDPLIGDSYHIDWDNIFATLNKLGGIISVNSYRAPGLMSLLDIAVRRRNLIAAKKLLEVYKADPNIPNPHVGTTQLIAAINNNDLPMIQLLLHYGASPTLQDDGGSDSFYWARNNPKILALLEQYR